MDFRELKFWLDDDSIDVDAVIILNAAFETATKCPTWEIWLSEISKIFSQSELQKLTAASSLILDSLGDCEFFGMLAITVERSAGDGLDAVVKIPRHFPEFILKNLN